MRGGVRRGPRRSLGGPPYVALAFGAVTAPAGRPSIADHHGLAGVLRVRGVWGALSGPPISTNESRRDGRVPCSPPTTRTRRSSNRPATLSTAPCSSDPTPAALILLARTWFLIGELRARTDDERLAAYERGRDVGRRAVDAAPQSADAHLWYAINLGRWAQTKGFFRAAMALSTVKEEVEVVLRLDPRLGRGPHPGGQPRCGASRPARWQSRPRRGGVPPRPRARSATAPVCASSWRDSTSRTSGMPTRAASYKRALDEPAPSDLPYWTVRGLPRARALLESIKDKP